uniref:Sterile alpha motif domain-containing protein 5 n=1 Tax=Eptatretus burgeri TaxID=7764 RepID=A0A8C4NCU5_EPTBU
MAANVVAAWLQALRLPQYTSSFLDNGYDDLEVCRHIEDADLDAIGVTSLLHRRAIRTAVARLRTQAMARPGPDYCTLEAGLSWDPDWLEPTSLSCYDWMPQAPPARVTYPRLRLKIMLRDKLARDGIRFGGSANKVYTNKINVSTDCSNYNCI